MNLKRKLVNKESLTIYHPQIGINKLTLSVDRTICSLPAKTFMRKNNQKIHKSSIAHVTIVNMKII